MARAPLGLRVDESLWFGVSGEETAAPLRGALLRILTHQAPPRTIALRALRTTETPGGADARQQLLGASMLVALANQSGAWLWASALEAIERPAASIAGIANAIVEGCSTTAAMLFADAAADFTTEAPAVCATRGPIEIGHCALRFCRPQRS